MNLQGKLKSPANSRKSSEVFFERIAQNFSGMDSSKYLIDFQQTQNTFILCECKFKRISDRISWEIQLID